MFIKKIACLICLIWTLGLCAKTTVQYVFDQVIDENIKDQSGNNCVPIIAMKENSWVSKGEDGIRFSQAADEMRIPFTGFPGNHGVMKIRINFDQISTGKEQTIWRVYGLGDGMQLQLDRTKGRLTFSYYNRADKKWFKASCPNSLIKIDKWLNVTCSWQFGGNLEIAVDDAVQGKTALAGVTPTWDANTVMILGNDIKNSAPFAGVIRSFSLESKDGASDTIVIPAIKPAAKELLNSPGISISKNDVKLEVDQNYLTLRSLKDDKSNTEFLSGQAEIPLWELALVNKDNFTKSIIVNSQAAAKRSIERTPAGLELNWKNIAIPGESAAFDVKAGINWDSSSDDLIWKIQVGNLPRDWRILNINYPCLSLKMTNREPDKNFLVWPFRWGRLTRNPFGVEKKFTTEYPGSMHFQFCFLYGEGHPGLYLAVLDGIGYYKELSWQAVKTKNQLIQSVIMTPEQRGISGSFDQPYPIVTSIMPGNWYDAACKYRAWATKQIWCQNGTLTNNKQVPEWYKKNSIAMKWSTEKIGRTIPNNLTNTKWITGNFGTPAMGIWYHYRGNWDSSDSAGVKNDWFGCLWNARIDAKIFPGVEETVREMRKQNVYLIGYINSRIYDQSLTSDHPETLAVEPHTMKTPEGKIELYSNNLYEGCRYDPWWQYHILNYCREGVEKIGFSGMYLDSFGRGQYFCYAKNHGHPPGSSLASISGMRNMGIKIKTELRKINPEIILSSEASIEQFVDLIDAKLLHYNIFTECCPIWQVLYHDYQLTYGRSIYPAESPDRLLSARTIAASTFHIGAQIGRFRADDNPRGFAKDWDSPVGKALFNMLDKMIIIRDKNLKFIGVGKMLRPAMITPNPALKMTAEKFELEVPEIFTSSWQAEDLQAGIFFTNITGEPRTFKYEFNREEYQIGAKSPYLISVNANKLIIEKPYAGNTLTLDSGQTMGIIFK
ncbi:MAG: DUF6259 domain-containing protein [Lentisphaerota bacterium]